MGGTDGVFMQVLASVQPTPSNAKARHSSADAKWGARYLTRSLMCPFLSPLLPPSLPFLSSLALALSSNSSVEKTETRLDEAHGLFWLKLLASLAFCQAFALKNKG